MFSTSALTTVPPKADFGIARAPMAISEEARNVLLLIMRLSSRRNPSFFMGPMFFDSPNLAITTGRSFIRYKFRSEWHIGWLDIES